MQYRSLKRVTATAMINLKLVKHHPLLCHQIILKIKKVEQLIWRNDWIRYFMICRYICVMLLSYMIVIMCIPDNVRSLMLWSINIIMLQFCLADTPGMRTSTIMWTLYLVWNAISLDLHTNRPPEMRTSCYSMKWTLGLAPTISLSIQTHPYSGHFGTKFIDSLVQQTARRTRYTV